VRKTITACPDHQSDFTVAFIDTMPAKVQVKLIQKYMSLIDKSKELRQSKPTAPDWDLIEELLPQEYD